MGKVNYFMICLKEDEKREIPRCVEKTRIPEEKIIAEAIKKIEEERKKYSKATEEKREAKRCPFCGRRIG